MGQTKGSVGIEEDGPRMISPQLARALSNPLRARILVELNLRDMSPSRFVEEVGGEITSVAREFRKLREWGFVEVVERRHQVGRRGGVESVYRPLVRDFLDTPTWAALPRFVREDLTINSVDFYITRIRESIGTGNFDREVERHFSWVAPVVDREGWEEIQKRLDELLDWISEAEARATARLKESGEAPIPMTVGLSAFRSPTPAELAEHRAQRRADSVVRTSA